jgi:hypothetical protein
MDDGSAWVAGASCDATTNTFCDAGECRDTCADAAAEHSYLGCDYFAVTLANPELEGMGGHFPFAIALGNSHPYDVVATIDGADLATPITHTVPANDLAVIQLPWVQDLAQLCGESSNPACTDGTSILRRSGAYHVHVDSPVAAYQFNPLVFSETEGGTDYYSYTNDASLLLPIAALSQNYRTLAFPWERLSLRGSGGIVAIVGTTDATTVMVTLAGDVTPTTGTFGPHAEMVMGASTGQTLTFTLGRGDVVELVGMQYDTDMAGTRVAASAPVAVFSGNTCEQIPFDRHACDHLEQQMIPTEAWGHRYAVTQFIDRPGLASAVRILAEHANTMLTFDPADVQAPTTLHAGQVLDIATNEDFVVTASEPISVVQGMYGGDTAQQGDPSLVLEVPTDQYRQDYTFLAPDTYTRSFVNIVGPSGMPPTFDGATVSAMESAIGGSGLSVWALEIMPGAHTIRSNGQAYGVKVYAVARYTSYAYPGGLDLHFISPPM